jgi:hypothetical protein
VKRALQDHPKREAIVKANREITQREALAIMREWQREQKEGKQKKKSEDDGKAEERKRWLRGLCKAANKHGRDTEEAMQDEELMRALREVAEPEVVTALVSDLEVVVAFAKLLQHQDEDIERAERRKPHLEEAEGMAA